ncbi:MAG: dTMP kinase [Betaproteobacteria bacterium]|nr:dTMP kinase [Betaproteobacteria bacterium]
MPQRGRLITLEGVDGAGKSTHLDSIRERLHARGHRVIVTREPGGTELAEKLRALVLSQPMDALSETLLMFAARADHVQRVIAPAIAAGAWVLCDRFTDATLAYQGAGKGVAQDLIERLAEAVHPGLQPDRTFLFDCSYEVSKQRLGAAGKQLDRFEREDREFFERVRKGYLVQAVKQPQRFTVVDASRELAEIRQFLAVDIDRL